MGVGFGVFRGHVTVAGLMMEPGRKAVERGWLAERAGVQPRGCVLDTAEAEADGRAGRRPPHPVRHVAALTTESALPCQTAALREGCGLVCFRSPRA